MGVQTSGEPVTWAGLAWCGIPQRNVADTTQVTTTAMLRVTCVKTKFG
ncbi:MAG: hypothetical protein WCI55_06145 [Armatimonadota bacterium]